MKRLLCLLCCLLMAVSVTACGKSSQTMYIEPANLTEEEKNIAELLGLNTEQRIFDFRLDDSVKSMQVNTYELADGQWELISGGGGREISDDKGRIALGFEDLADGIRIAIQSEHQSGATSYTQDTESDTTSMATSVLSGRKEILLEQEIPLVVQIHTSQNVIRSYSVDFFFQPEDYAQYGYDHVYAVTVLFSQKTVGELSSQ